jgi:hypothetical protein
MVLRFFVCARDWRGPGASCRAAGVAVDPRPTSPRPLAGSRAAPRALTRTEKKAEPPDARSRPLLVREGARYDCFGDGLCCTDIHALGPVTARERRAVQLLEPGTLVRHKDLLAPVFRTQPHGPCVLRSERGCELHARHGAEAKPAGCARFPFGLIATPEGGRITTEHRCPCRTLGERPPLTAEASYTSLVDAADRLVPDGRVGPRVRLEPGRRASFARFRELERPLIAGLLAGGEPLSLLQQRPFGRLTGASFRALAGEMRRERDGTAYGEAMLWFGNATAALVAQRPLELAPRPWSEAFDRAQARSPVAARAETVLNDWLADLVWSLDWVFATDSFEAGKRELATLYSVARAITKRLVRARARPDRAAAEAVMIAEIARQSQAWETVQAGL